MNQNMQNRTMSELHTDDKKSLYSRNQNHMLESAKNFYEKLYIKETDFIAEPFSKISNKK